MASIKDSELRPAGFELFQDSESFLDELSDDWELNFVGVSNIVASDVIRFPSFRISCVTVLSPSTVNEDISHLNLIIA